MPTTIAEERSGIIANLDAAKKEQVTAQLAYLRDKSPTSMRRRTAANERVAALADDLAGLDVAEAQVLREERAAQIRMGLKDLDDRRTQALQAIDALPALYEKMVSLVPKLALAWMAYESAFMEARRLAIFGAAKHEVTPLQNGFLPHLSAQQTDTYTPLTGSTIVSDGRDQLERFQELCKLRIEKVHGQQKESLENELLAIERDG